MRNISTHTDFKMSSLLTSSFASLLGILVATVAVACPPAILQEEVKDQEATVISPEQQEKAEELFQKGRKLFFQGEYQTAAVTLAESVELNPDKTSYQLLLARSHRYAGQNDAAMKALERILEANPEHVDAGIDLAELLSPGKEPERVISILKPLLKFNHDYPIYHLLAEAHYQLEDFDTARGYFEEATNLNPRNADDHYQLGNIYLAQKHFAKSAQAYEEAGRLGMTTGVYHFKLASVYFNLHNYLGKVTTGEVIGGKAGDIKQEMYLIDAIPGKQDQFYVAGPRSAIFQTAMAKKLGIDIFDIDFLEANIWLSARRYENADRIYVELEDKVAEGDTGLYWYYRAQAALGLKNYDEYLERLDKAIEAEPDVYESTLSDAYVTVANGYHQLGENDRYLEYLQKAVQNNPLSATLHLTLGDAFWLSSAADKAINQYRLVLELEPDHPQRVRLLNRIRDQEDVSGQ